MKKNILLSLLLVIIVACGGGGDGGGTPEINKNYLSVPPNMTLLADGESQNLQIDANCSWAITSDSEWLSVSPMSGTNRQTVTVTAGRNSSGNTRTAILTVSGGSLTRRVAVTQAKAADPVVTYNLSVDKETLHFEKKGGTMSFIITSNTNWTISYPDWCTLSTTSGNGNATITITASENTTTSERTGKLTIKGNGVNAKEISVSQAPGDAHEPGADDNLPPS
jgi:hypothetical protein